MSEFLIGLITVLIYLAVVATWFFTLFDLFARGDIGLSKVLWLFAIVFVPLLGVLAYYLLRPRQPVQDLWWQTDANLQGRQSEGIATELQTLDQLRKDGALSDEEFVRLKNRVMA